MRAMQVSASGAALAAVDVPVPVPGPDDVRIKVHTCGINFADTLMVKGKYQEKQTPPFTPGLEVCGTVDAVGGAVNDMALGTRVAAYAGVGGLAEFVCLPRARCVAAPDAMTDAEVAGFQIAYGTSHVALDHCAKLKPGERLVVLGASGGVGLTAVEIGRVMGAEVIAVARGAEKRAVAQKAGAHHVFDNADDIRSEIKALGGADVVYDPVGGALFDAAFRACNPMARLLPLGFASGDVPQIPANILLVKNISVHGLYWGAYAKLAPAVMADSFRQLFAWYEDGKLKPLISDVLPLEDAQAALDMLRNRTAVGKVVVQVAQA
ncbi:MAG: NADPH:quinone oxidoreductase family protein [Pseudomonadota bacterium]